MKIGALNLKSNFEWTNISTRKNVRLIKIEKLDIIVKSLKSWKILCTDFLYTCLHCSEICYKIHISNFWLTGWVIDVCEVSPLPPPPIFFGTTPKFCKSFSNIYKLVFRICKLFVILITALISSIILFYTIYFLCWWNNFIKISHFLFIIII